MHWTVTLNAVIDHVYVLEGGSGDAAELAIESHHVPAGKGVNVSRALASLGATSTAIVVSDAAHASRYEASLREVGVHPRLLVARPAVRHHATIVQAGGSHLHARERGSACAAECAAGVGAALQAVAPGDDVAFSGSLPPGLPADTYAVLAQGAQGRGARAWLDCAGEALRAGLAAMPYGVKVNGREAGLLWGTEVATAAQAAAAIDRFLAAGATLACVTLGGDGLVVGSRDGVVHARAAAQRSGSGVGSGDATLAALMLATAARQSPADTALFAAAVGAANVGSTAPGGFSEEQVRAHLAVATVHPLAR